MRKHLLVVWVMLFLWSSSCNEENAESKKIRKKVFVTDLDHEPVVKELLAAFKQGSASGRVANLEISDAFFKYEDADSGILNYTFPLSDSASHYFENLVLSQYENGFYGFIYRYIPEDGVSDAESFRGTLQQYDLSERLIGEYTIPFDGVNPAGRSQLINQCVRSIEQTCVTTYEVETVTDYPCHCQYDRRTQVSSVCTFSFNMGWCDDMISLPPGGGGTYVGIDNGPVPGGGGGAGAGVKSPKKKPIVILPDKDYYAGDKCIDCIENQLKNPCLKVVADRVFNPAIASTYNKLIQDVFNKNDKVNLILREDPNLDKEFSPKPGYVVYGHAGVIQKNGPLLNVLIRLNPSHLNDKLSQEFIGAVIYHETFHALIDYFDPNDKVYVPSDDHLAMFTNYLDLLASGLQKAFPNITIRDAQGLILGNVLAYEKEYESLLDKILVNKGFTRAALKTLDAKYKNGSVAGTSCN